MIELFNAVGLRGGLMALAMAALAACQPQVGPPEPQGRVTSIGDAVKAFEDICLDTAPSFAGAKARYARHGLSRPGRGKIVYDTSGTMSVRVDTVDGPKGQVLRCSLVYEDPNRYIAVERIDQMIADRRSAIGRVRGAKFPTVQGGVRDGRAWQYRARGQLGELLDVAHTGKGNLGVLMLQFPANRT